MNPLEAHGALLVNKPDGISSFGVIEVLQRTLRKKMQEAAGGARIKRQDLPKLGHGGTLDPFATGLLVVCVGNGAKLARYLLGSQKVYEGTIVFGQTTVPGDPTSPITETSAVIPQSLEEVQAKASEFCGIDYMQTPPMHSAKKLDGKPLYELARQGIEVERKAQLCKLAQFEILSYAAPRAEFRVTCTAGTYIRVLAQDLGRKMGGVAMLERLHRVGSGKFNLDHAMTLPQIEEALEKSSSVQASSPPEIVTSLENLPCWIPFDQILAGYPQAQITVNEERALIYGQQSVLIDIIARIKPPAELECLTLFRGEKLAAVTRKEEGAWKIERVFI